MGTRREWGSARLGDVLTLYNGRAYKQSELLRDESCTPVLRIQNLKGGDSWYYSDLELSPEKYCYDGDLLFAWSASFGPFRWRGVKAIFHYHIWRVVTNQHLDDEFAFHLLAGITRNIKKASQGGLGMLHMTKRGMEHWEVVLPPLPEQRKIAAILSSVDEAIEKTQVVIDRAQVVKKGLMQELLTKGLPGRHKTFKQTEIGRIPESWEVASIERLAQLVTSGSRGWAKYYSDAGALFVRSQNVRSGHFSWSDRQHVQPPPGAEGKRTAVSIGDVLITITGNSVGNVASVREDLGEAYISQHVGMVRLQDPALSDLVEYWLAPGAPGNRQILEAQYGQSKPGLNLKSLRSLIVPIPPVGEMNSVVDRLHEVRERVEAEHRCLGELQRLKTALMSVLLTGELRVRPDPEPA